MAEPNLSSEALHVDRARLGTTDWFLLVGGVFATAFGLATLDPLVLLFASLVVLFFAFVTHRAYELYDDRLIILYWMPRRRTVARKSIASAGRVRLPLKPESVILELTSGRNLIVTPGGLDAFLAYFPKSQQGRPASRSQPGGQRRKGSRPRERR